MHTLYGQQMGGRKSYNPKNKGKKSYQPIVTFLAETREYIGGELRNGDRPSGQQIARHLEIVFAALPQCVHQIFARADAGFYCWKAVEDPLPASESGAESTRSMTPDLQALATLDRIIHEPARLMTACSP